MTISDSDIAFVHELFDGVGQITHRKMMGGLTVYADGQVFAILTAEGRPYLKAKGAFAEEMAGAGSEKFEFVDKTGKVLTMGYWSLPEAALDDPDLACDWARRALAAL
jgi:DNA transformation protein